MATLGVITATYNAIRAGRGDTLREAFASLAAQSRPPDAHVLVDGGSDDGTADLLRRLVAAQPNAYKNAVHQTVVSEPDQGIYDAWNKGLAWSGTDYVMVLNSDDYLCRADALAALATGAEASSADIVYGQQVFLSAEGREKLWTRMNLATALVRMPIGMGSAAFKSDTVTGLGGWNPAFPIAGDYDLVLRLLAAEGSGHEVAKPIAVLRAGGVSDHPEKGPADHAAVWRARFEAMVPGLEVPIDAALRWYAAGQLPDWLLRRLADVSVPGSWLAQAVRYERKRNWRRRWTGRARLRV
ncbi:MAG: glycosyltransferase [Pseudomonadota bacterium]